MPPFIQTAPPPPPLQQQQEAAFPAAPIDDGVWPLPPEVAWRSDARRRFAVVDDVIVVATEAGGVGEVAGEAGAGQGVLHQAHRPRQDHPRPTDIVDNILQKLLNLFGKIPKHYSDAK